MQIRGHLAALARTACTSALAALHARAEALDARPEALPDFAAYQVPVRAALYFLMLPCCSFLQVDTCMGESGIAWVHHYRPQLL